LLKKPCSAEPFLFGSSLLRLKNGIRTLVSDNLGPWLAIGSCRQREPVICTRITRVLVCRFGQRERYQRKSWLRGTSRKGQRGYSDEEHSHCSRLQRVNGMGPTFEESGQQERAKH